MCIVAVKPIGSKLPDKKSLENCFENNPDGCGYMFVRDNRVKIRKGFLDFDTFYADFLSQKLTKNDIIAYHFRIATAGSICRGNTHPFPLSNIIDDLVSLNIDCDIAMAHNGILSMVGNKIGNHHISDTMDFVINILSDKGLIANLDNRAIRSLLESKIRGSKIAILKSSGDYSLLGSPWITDNDMIWSNDTYKKQIITIPKLPKYTFGNKYTDNKYKGYGLSKANEYILDAYFEQMEDKEKEKEEKDECITTEYPECPECSNDYTITHISEFHPVYECDLCGSIFHLDGSLLYA